MTKRSAGIASGPLRFGEQGVEGFCQFGFETDSDAVGWIREAVAQVLSSNQELSDTQLGDLVDRFKIEKGFEDRPEGFEDILSNAHVEGLAVTPSAAVTYVLNGQEDTIQWQNEPGVAPFTRISVFDAPAVMLHVDNELNYVFTSREIALFSYVAIQPSLDDLKTDWANADAARKAYIA